MEPNLNYMTSLHLEWQTLTSRTLTANIKRTMIEKSQSIYSDKYSIGYDLVDKSVIKYIQ